MKSMFQLSMRSLPRIYRARFLSTCSDIPNKPIPEQGCGKPTCACKSRPFEFDSKPVEKETKALSPTEQQLAELNSNVSSAYRKGDHKEALMYAIKSVDLARSLFQTSHPALASALNNLALIHKDLGNFKTSVALYEEALNEYKASVGENHPSYASVAHNIALMYRQLKDLEKARIYFEIALRIREQLNSTSLDFASTLHNLGAILCDLDVTAADQAIQMQEKALQIIRRRVGEEHDATASALFSLGSSYQAKQQPDKSLSYYLSSLAIRQRCLPPTHPALIMTYSKVLTCYEQMQQFEEAQQISAILMQHLRTHFPEEVNEQQHVSTSSSTQTQ